MTEQVAWPCMNISVDSRFNADIQQGITFELLDVQK